MACCSCFSGLFSKSRPEQRDWDDSMPPIFLWMPNTVNNYEPYQEPGYACGQVDYSNWKKFKVDFESAMCILNEVTTGKQLFIRVEYAEQLAIYLKTVSLKWHFLETLHIECCATVGPSCLQIIARYPASKLVKRIQCNGEVDAEHKVLEQFFRSCPNLESLHLASAPNLSVYSLNNLPPRLQSLFLERTAFQTDTLGKFLKGKAGQINEFAVNVCDGEQLKMICNSMKHLVTLRITLGGTDPPECLSALAELNNLRNLSFETSKDGVEAELLKVLANCPELKSLAVNSNCVSSTFMQSLPVSLPQLEALCVSDLGHSTERSSQGMRHLPALVPMAKLKTLCVRNHEKCVRPLIEFIENSPSLRNLDFIYPCGQQSLLEVFEGFSKKASATPHEEFVLRFAYVREELVNVPENLFLYCF